MLDQRFSAEAFNTIEKGAEEAELLNLLADEILLEIQEAVEKEFGIVIDQLNEMGHNLKLYGEQDLCDFSYRDDLEDTTGYHCKLRVGFTGIVSTGHSHI